jgi:hypothetical protein
VLTHRQPIHNVEWKLADGVVPAWQAQGAVGQLKAPETFQNLP